MSESAPPRTESPFLKEEPVRIKFSVLILLLLTVVGAGLSMLLLLALRVPALSTELRATMGLVEIPSDPESSRKAHIIFVIFLYTAPLGLGILVYLLHYFLNWLNRISQTRKEPEEFRMD
jgi:sterol desaturase/sphingolipid hydroxylase (fatty acid hydroxylase superfamily)